MAVTVGLSSALAGLAFFFNREGLSFSSVREEYLIKDILDTNYIDPNALCYVFIGAMIVVGMGLASNTARGVEQTILYLLFAVNFCWTFLVGSRGGILVASVCALYILFSARSTSRRFQMIAAGMLATLFVINAFPQFRDRTFHRVDQLVDQDLTVADRTSNRSDFVVAAWRMFSSSPVGVGTGGFRYSWSNLDDTRGLRKGSLKYQKSSHSAWLKTIAENGFPGIVLFTAFVFSFAFAGLRIGRSDSIALGFLVTAVLSVSFISTQFQSKGLWFMVAAAIVFLYHRRIPAPAAPTRSLSQPILHAGQIVKG
ncbi:MAG: O-antigen ligase family protein [Pirellulaceae bacterium]|nr:O-antigen ligase family protein [Pirellulaceae bacterium]